MADFGYILAEIGCYGRFQRKILALCFVVGVVCGFNSLNTVFTHYTPAHKCTVINTDNQSTLSLIPNETNRWGETVQSSCKQYNSSGISGQDAVIPCQNGWTYTGPFHSAISEFDLVCSFIWVKSTVLSGFFAARIVALLVIGFIVDKFGRKRTLLALLFLNFATSLAVSLSPNVFVYAVLMPLYGSTGSPSYMTMYNLGSELTGPKWRNHMNFAINSGYIFAYVILPLIAYLSHSWRIYLKIISCWALLALIICIKFLPESSRWLMSKNNRKEALKCLQEIAKENNYKGDVEALMDGDSKKFIEEDVKVIPRNVPTFVECLRNVRFIVKLLVVSLTWITLNITYFGLALNTSSFGGNIFMNCLYAGLMELPCILIAFKLMDKIGRPLTIASTLILGGLFCILSPLLKPWNVAVSAGAAIVGKNIITGAYYVVVGYTTEVLPTVIRARFYNICGSCGKFGAFISPFIMLIGEVVNPYFAFFTMGIGAIGAGVLNFFFMPETNKQNLPETLEDVNNMNTLK